jgi:methyltransferase (TIGR00027 family)
MKVFEIDCASDLQQKKIHLLQTELRAVPKAKEIQYLTANLAQDNWNELLLTRGFDPKVSTFWCLEGFLYYLKQDEIVKILKTIDSLSAPKSQFWVDLCGHELEHEAIQVQATSEKKAILKYGENDPLNDGILTILHWDLVLQAKMDQNHKYYYGRGECDPILGSTKDSNPSSMEIPWFFIYGTKPAQPSPAQLN